MTFREQIAIAISPVFVEAYIDDPERWHDDPEILAQAIIDTADEIAAAAEELPEIQRDRAVVRAETLLRRTN